MPLNANSPTAVNLRLFAFRGAQLSWEDRPCHFPHTVLPAGVLLIGTGSGRVRPWSRRAQCHTSCIGIRRASAAWRCHSTASAIPRIHGLGGPPPGDAPCRARTGMSQGWIQIVYPAYACVLEAHTSSFIYSGESTARTHEGCAPSATS